MFHIMPDRFANGNPKKRYDAALSKERDQP
jgi:hypothetical protein